MNNQNVHPIHILYSVIALAIVIWSVLYYQVKNTPVPPVVENNVQQTDSLGLTPEKREMLKSEMNDPANSPQISADTRQKMMAQMAKDQNTPQLSAEERERILKELTNQ